MVFIPMDSAQPSSLSILRVEGLGLPHLEFVDGGAGARSCSDEPGLAGVPGFGLFFGPAHGLGAQRSRGQASHNKRCRLDEVLESSHSANSGGNHIRGICNLAMVEVVRVIDRASDSRKY